MGHRPRPCGGAIGETPEYTSYILTAVAFVPLATNVIVQLWNIALALAEARAKRTAGIKGAFLATFRGMPTANAEG